MADGGDELGLEILPGDRANAPSSEEFAFEFLNALDSFVLELGIKRAANALPPDMAARPPNPTTFVEAEHGVICLIYLARTRNIRSFFSFQLCLDAE